MCVPKKEAKQMLIEWAVWMNKYSDGGGSVVGGWLGHSSDGKCSPSYLKTAGCRGSGMRIISEEVLMPDEIKHVDLALGKLDSGYHRYAEIFFRWKIATKSSIGECIEQYCKEYGLTARQYKDISLVFYAKVCSIFA